MITDPGLDAILDERLVLMPRLHKGQEEVLRHKARFKVLAAGAQWGKSMLAAGAAISSAANGGSVWWIYPDHPLATIGWSYLKHLARQIPWAEIAEGDRVVTFPSSGGFVQIKSTGQLLRGRPLDLAIFDEAAFCPEDSWQKEVAPRLSTRKGRALFISTPCGFNWFNKIWNLGNDPAYPDWKSWKFPTSSNPWIDPREIESARGRLTDQAFKQEYLADFVAMSGAVFPSFSRRIHVRNIETNYNAPLFMGIDFGFRVAAAGFFQVTSGGEVHIVGDAEFTEEVTAKSLQNIAALYYGDRPLPDVLRLIGCDPAGTARNQQSGYSDVEITKRYFPRAQVVYSTSDRHRSPEWRAARIRDLLLAEDGTIRLYVDERCQRTIRMFENSIYPAHKPGQDMKQEPLKDGVYDHLRDAIGYGLVNANVFGRVGATGEKLEWL